MSFGKKKINAEINRITTMVKETKFLVTGLPGLDGSGTADVPDEIFIKVANRVLKAGSETTFLILTAGATGCQALAHVPADLATEGKLNAKDWMEHLGLTVTGPSPDGQFLMANCTCECSLKVKDQITSNAFAYLRKAGLFEDEESSDEMPEFDW